MSRLTLLTDFDGPIVDVSERYYQVYQVCLQKMQQQFPEATLTYLDKATFWGLKRAKVSETDIGIRSGLTPEQARQFSQCRQETVHTFPYFELDRLQPGVREVLASLEPQGIDVYVITMRRVRELTFALRQFALESLLPFSRCYCVADDFVKTADHLDKPLVLARALAAIAPSGPVGMVGDTEADIIAAQTHGIPVVAVTCGIRDAATLQRYQPDSIQPDLVSAVRWLSARRPDPSPPVALPPTPADTR
ncbi:MAG: HAD family hydrolase [Gloeomargarita sp. SKYBB_i_bin120]|nr:HAD family hydrolase [Gloeomargarita sp. SKYG98]MCS7291840.1 HAD family hydrolase [Gloeomargarita sp. SKYB120]MDW8177400.1 HAD family hydrolase [Gloeomargarita sp. SKYBB_i_bin120]